MRGRIEGKKVLKHKEKGGDHLTIRCLIKEKRDHRKRSDHRTIGSAGEVLGHAFQEGN